MAKTLETKLAKYGQIGFNVGDLIPKDAKLRLETKWFGYTIDLGKKVEPKKAGKGGGISIMNMLKPNATILLSGKAYRLDPNDPNKIREVDARIFNTPTGLDKLMDIGILPIIGGIAITGVLIYFLVKKDKK